MEGRKGKAIAFRKGRSSRERVTGERKNDRERDIIYHPAVCRRNSLQMLFNLPDGKPSCFLESRPRSASCRHSYAANFLPVAPFLLIPTLALAKLPFHESLPWSLQFSFLLRHLPLPSHRVPSFFASLYLFSLTRQ